jgi:Na+/H+ antiporter NhaA
VHHQFGILAHLCRIFRNGNNRGHRRMGIVPISGSSNAGVSFVELTAHKLTDHITLGVALGLIFGKLVGVFGSAFLTFRLG